MTTGIGAQTSELSPAPNKSGASGHRSYRDLLVWQRSIQLSVAIYRFTGDFPNAELYGLTSQLRRAAVSVASNIAEGYGRATKGEFRQFVGIARGSILEVQTQLEIAKQLGFGKETQRRAADALAEETGKMTWALMQKL
ncbi:MAG: four helix bundle protein [Acidobacteriaceae bacterium]